MSEKGATINARIPAELRQRLDARAKICKCTRGAVLREALEYYLSIVETLKGKLPWQG